MSTGSLTTATTAWTQARDEFACDHGNLYRVTAFTAANGVRHYRRQCTRCGANLGSVKRTAIPPSREPGLPAWDQSLADAWQDRVRLRVDELYREERGQKKEVFDIWYVEYLESPQWACKREKVLARAGGRCEGCGERRATQVHHLTYTHVGREFLFQLVAVCRDCHDQIHACRVEPE